MLKILQARFQQNVNQELPDGFRKGRGTSDQIANIRWIIEKATGFQKNIYFCFIDYAKAFDFVDHNKLWEIRKEMGLPDHLTCLLRNLYAGREATVRTRRGTADWFQIGKGVRQGCILSPCLFIFFFFWYNTNKSCWYVWLSHRIHRRFKFTVVNVKDSCYLASSWIYTEYIMQNARLDEAQAGIKIKKWSR